MKTFAHNSGVGLYKCAYAGQRPTSYRFVPGCRGCAHKLPHVHGRLCDANHEEFSEASCPGVCEEITE